jgi:ATP-dependent DNA ligase
MSSGWTARCWSTVLGRSRWTLEALDLPARGVPVASVYGWEQILDLFRACGSLGVEGIVLMDLNGRYTPGRRSDAWRKVKCDAWQEHQERRLLSPR